MSGFQDDPYLPTVGPLGAYGSSGMMARGDQPDPGFVEDRNDPEPEDYATENETEPANPPLPDQGSYDGDHGEGIDDPEEQPGVGA